MPAALHWHERLDPIHPIGLATAGMHVRIDETGADGVDADALLGDLLRQADGHRIHRAFGCRVIDVFARRAEARSSRRDIHDRATGAAMPG